MSSFFANQKNFGLETLISVKEARKLLPKKLSDNLTDKEVERIVRILSSIAHGLVHREE